ncbi:MAG: Gfo/Idh/MocA family oxidoreductase [Actinomycetales bacterium]|nr:Gfo/Idh/MocA family oxidoreductase [Actinomycetales bacterium]
MTRIGVGLISAGWMGTVHSRGYLAVGDKYPELGVSPELVVVADTVEANSQRLVDRLGYARSTTDYRDVLADPGVDVVSIAAPNSLHKEFALAAAAAGKPFWIEKPMGAGVADSRAIAAAVDAAGLVTAVGFNYRHAPAVQHLRDLVRSGQLGRVTNVRVRLDADYSADPAGPRTWRFVKEQAGTGVLGDLLSHGFDLGQYVLADPVSEVSAITATFIPQRPEVAAGGVGHQVRAAADAPMLPVENEDWAAVHARFASGAVGTFESSRVAVGPRCEYSIAVYGTRGSAVWDFERMNEVAVCLQSDGSYGYTRILTDPSMGAFGRFQVGAGMGLSFDDLKVIEAALFLESVLTGEQTAPSVADGLAAAEVAHAADTSAQDGTWHTVPAPTGRTTFAA